MKQALGTGSHAALMAAVDAIRRLRAWCDHHELRVLHELSVFTTGAPEQMADTARVSLRDTDRVSKRATTVEQIPALADALADGAISGAHIDAAGRVLRSLEPEHQEQFTSAAAALVPDAAALTADQFATRLQREARRILHDSGVARLERQRRDTRLKFWANPTTGMYHLAGRFDPLTGAQIHELLQSTATRLFSDGVPDTAPSDPLERQDHLRALALVHLLHRPAASGTSDGARGGKPPTAGRLHASVLIDLTQLDADGPHLDWGLPLDIPHAVLRDLLPDAHLTPVIVEDGVIVWAPGELNQGRRSRLANKAQRRALRARYPRCVVHGCGVHFINCKIHHLIWWRHGGRTDLVNLAPVCTKHHGDIHAGQLTLTRQADWSFTTTYKTLRPPGPTATAA